MIEGVDVIAIIDPFNDPLALAHYGTPRHSGRYPWGSGENPYQRTKNWINHVTELRKSGLTDTEIARSMNMSTTQYRAKLSVARDSLWKEDNAQILALKDKGWSTMAISRRTGIPEATVRTHLNEATQERRKILNATTDALKEELKRTGYLDVSEGSEIYLGVSQTRLATSLAKLKEEGYTVENIYISQVADPSKNTTMKVLANPNTPIKELYDNMEKIEIPMVRTEDNGETWGQVEPPKSIDRDRVYIRYREDGGTDVGDGLIELRPGVEDISLGKASYAQCRIAVADKYYMKGMAYYSDDIPAGYDVVYNVNKSRGTADEDVFKKLKADPMAPFGAAIKERDEDVILAQRHYIDENGERQLSSINIVNEEGSWSKWDKNLSSQFLGKQRETLAKKQLDLDYDIRKADLDEILSIKNPVVRGKLLTEFADECDSAAVDLKAAALPGQSTNVLLPFSSIKENEIYASGYNNGDKVVLVRYPHAGRFELAELTVNNKNPDAKRVIGQSTTGGIDAVGINPKVAQKLSGADFDGDTVIVIPNNDGAVKTAEALKGLVNFEPKDLYKLPKDAPTIKSATKQLEMGKVSNLITDMTLKKASDDEICRAVKHSMVVIDSEKHHLDYKKSAEDNGIAELKEKYQGGANKGASTLLSRASGEARVDERKEGRYEYDEDLGRMVRRYIDPKTGEKLYTETGRTFEKNGKTEKYQTEITQMEKHKDAYELSSGTRMESIYANYANQCKALGNKARLASLATESYKVDPIAREEYKKEVASIEEKLIKAKSNAPLERKAQVIANVNYKAWLKENPDADKDSKKKTRGRLITQARNKIGAGKKSIPLTEREWEAAIDKHAISPSKLKDVLNNTKPETYKQYAMPKDSKGISNAKLVKAQNLLNRDYTRSQVAEMLGVSVSTLDKALYQERKG